MSFRLPSGPFALLRRAGQPDLELFTGTVTTVDRLADIPLPDSGAGPTTLALVPYRQVAERGFAVVDDGAPLECLNITGRGTVAAADLPDLPAPRQHGGHFDVSDADYARVVETVLRDEIGRGEGSNFVIHRAYQADVDSPPLTAALSAFIRLLRNETGTYWTFLLHTGTRTLVGATPERHVSVADGLVMMNPISGTYRHPANGPDRADLLSFLGDRKETEELYMVLDEELKMMATVARGGGQVIGPYLKPMAHLHHTEYLLAGSTALDVRDVLRETMFAPTVVGSPIENACRVIARHERRGRGYYGGVLALLGHDEAGRQTLDAPILIRTAELSPHGRLRVPVGATLVRHSTTAGEVAETHTKAAGVLAAFTDRPIVAPERPGPDLTADPEIIAALAGRNRHLARFWLDQRDDSTVDPRLHGRTVLIIDAEDTFTGMLAHQLRALGLAATGCTHESVPELNRFDLVVFGPGPGDPGSTDDPKMIRLRALIIDRLAAGDPFLGICLGHQLTAAALGLPLHRKEAPYQGTQREIDLFGQATRVGFYSTFTALSAEPVVETCAGPVTVSRDPESHEVYGLRAPRFASIQFHPESVLTEHGLDLLRELLVPLLAPADAVKTR